MSISKVLDTRRLLIQHDIYVGTYDIDFAGHVSNIVYLRWLEEMRSKVFNKYFPLEQFLNNGLSPVLTSTRIEYKRPIRLFDKPTGVMWVSNMGNVSFTMEGEICVDGTLAARAAHTGVFVRLTTMTPVRVPSICIQQFKESM